MVWAHWESSAPRLGCAVRPGTIHDFSGFPDELYRIRYPAPGAPDLALAAQTALRAAGLMAETEARGLDHGAWVPLLKMYPWADVPVLQLSVQPARDAAHHLALGAALGCLRAHGVLIVGSGHMTHNLRDWFLAQDDTPAAYAVAFREWVAARLVRGETSALLDWVQAAPQAHRAHPTPEHFLPLFVALGAAGAGAQATCWHAGYDRGGAGDGCLAVRLSAAGRVS